MDKMKNNLNININTNQNAIIKENIKAVIFDMDGVLIDTEKYLTKFWCQAANEAGYPMKIEQAYEIRSLAGRFGEQKLKKLFGDDIDYEAIRNRRKEIMNEHLLKHGIEKKPYLEKSLILLKEAGYKLAVATSTDTKRTEEYLSNIGVYDLFDDIICTNMVTNGKPEPDIYLYACDKLGLATDECLAVEDSPNGVISAYKAGMKVIMIPDLTKATKEDERRVIKVVNDLKQLAMILS